MRTAQGEGGGRETFRDSTGIPLHDVGRVKNEKEKGREEKRAAEPRLFFFILLLSNKSSVKSRGIVKYNREILIGFDVG